MEEELKRIARGKRDISGGEGWKGKREREAGRGEGSDR